MSVTNSEYTFRIQRAQLTGLSQTVEILRQVLTYHLHSRPT